MTISLNYLFKKVCLYQIVLYVAVLENSCPESSGITVQNQMELVSRLKWNHCPESNGIGVRIALEYAGKRKKSVLTYKEYEQIKDLDELPDNIAHNILLVPDQVSEDTWDNTDFSK